MVTLGYAAIPALVTAAATALPLPFCAAAADRSWIATKSLVHGISRSCGDDPVSDYAMETRGMILTGTPTRPGPWDRPLRVDLRTLANTLTFTTASRAPNSSFTVSFDALQPDGSGRVVAKDNKNRKFYVTLAPGSGARPFYLTYSYNACRRAYTSKA